MNQPILTPRPRRFARAFLIAGILLSLVFATSVFAAHAVDGVDVKVTIDNNNVDGGISNVTPSFDAQNRQSNEPTVSISGVPSPVTGLVGDIVAAGANDYRMVPHFGDSWMPVYLSFDGGASWDNTMIPGFPTDTSSDGLASPLFGLDGAGDPVVRFDAAGNLYVAGISFNRNFDQIDRQLDTVAFVAKYDYTPGSTATPSTTTTAGAPANFTYAGTSIVDRGAVGFAVPNQPFAFAGDFVDKEWMEIDLNSSEDSACADSVYLAFTSFHGVSGGSPIKFSSSSDGGATFSNARVISSGGMDGTARNQGADIAVASDGTIYVAYRTFALGSDQSSISLVKSNNCGKHWSQPVYVGAVTSGQASGVAFRTPTFAFVAVDDSDPNIVYVVYQQLAGDYDILSQRSTDGGATWESPVQVNTDPGSRHQIWPTVEVSNGTLHVAWYDFRNSVTPDNEALDVYYACSNCDGGTYPTFSHETRVTDISHNGNCQMFSGGSVAFHGDYIELDPFWDGANHVVQVVWTDNRDVPAGECDLTAGTAPSNSVGNRNQSIYTDRLIVAP